MFVPYMFAALSTHAWADQGSQGNDKIVIYVTRHADDEISLIDLGSGLFQQDCTPSACCVEVRSALGVERSARLAEWFQENHITETLDEVIATHKPRTADTVRQIAIDAGLNVGDTWVDQVPGDGVRNIPATPPECGDPAFEASGSSFSATNAYLHALPPGRTVLVAAHSTTVTRIMNAFGIATTDPTLFPGTPTRISGFNNLWKIEIDNHGVARLADHWVLDFALDATAHDNFGHGDSCRNEPEDHVDD